MTIEELRTLLQASGADAWELTEARRQVRECYCIRHAVDQHRIRDVRLVTVKVFRRFSEGDAEFLGSAGGEIPAGSDREEAARLIGSWLSGAAFVRNPVYTLVPPAGGCSAGEDEPDTADMLRRFLALMHALPETETEDVNSYEIFCGKTRLRFLNSRGVDRSCWAPEAMLEVVLNARRDGHEIELYRMITAGGCDEAALRASLTEALRLARARLEAGKTPLLRTADVLFSTEAALPLYEYFADRMDAAYKVRGYSDWTPGKPIADFAGDRVTLRAVPFLPGSSRNVPFDAEGAPIRETTLIEAGVPRRFLGGRQFSCYLGLEDSFRPSNLVFSGGTCGEDTLRAGAYLEVAEFSDFQVNSVTGDMAGEIRLAFWHDGTRCVPVSGGSVSGNMSELLRGMRMSEQTRRYDCRVIPALTRLFGVSVAGAANEETEAQHGWHRKPERAGDGGRARAAS